MDQRSESLLAQREIVSPELALVDPELARRAREWLPEPGEKEALASVPTRIELAPVPPTATSLPETPIRRTHPRRRRYVARLAAVALILAAILLLADVQVEIGKTPASADTQMRIMAIVPSAPKETPADAKAARKVHRFAWAPLEDAEGYRMALYRGDRKIFAAGTVAPAVHVPGRWEFAGRTHTLVPGDYRWYVWPVVSGEVGEPVVDAVLPVPPR